MKIFALGACAVMLMVICPAVMAQHSDKPTCAILTFEAKGGEVSASAVEMLSDRFSAEFARLGRCRMVSRSQMKEILQAQQFSLSQACSASECAVEAGKLLGVRYIVYGTIGKLGTVYSINSFMADVETGEQVCSATSDLRGSIEDVLTALMAVNAHRLLGLPVPDHLARVVQPPAPVKEPVQESDDYVYESTEIPLPRAKGKLETSPSIRPVSSYDYRSEPEGQAAYFGPRVGFSLYSGLAGAECQIGHLGVSAGIMPEGGFASGAKIYFHRYRSSLYLGFCYALISGDSETDVLGIGLGYRWRFGSGWDLTLGAGVSYNQDQESEDEDMSINSEQEDFYLGPVIDLSFGYSF